MILVIIFYFHRYTIFGNINMNISISPFRGMEPIGSMFFCCLFQNIGIYILSISMKILIIKGLRQYTKKLHINKFLNSGFEKGNPLSGLRRVQREPRVPGGRTVRTPFENKIIYTAQAEQLSRHEADLLSKFLAPALIKVIHQAIIKCRNLQLDNVNAQRLHAGGK